MKIALCHFRVGEIDGVSLEMDKWKKALEQLGHEVIFIAGSDERGEAEIIPELHYQYPINNKIVQQAYGQVEEPWSNGKLKDRIIMVAELIEKALLEIIRCRGIDLIIPNNILSLGWGLPAGIGFANAIKNSDVKALCHHHDFYWERDLYANPNCDFVKEILNNYFPPVHPRISHVCINSIAQKELKERHGVDADVVPNVFDFDHDLMKVDDYNRGMRAEFGIKDNDLVLLQATRVVERKAIEIAIDYVAAMEQTRIQLVNKKCYNEELFTEDSIIYLVLAGQSESPEYSEKLKLYAKEKGVNIKDISSHIEQERSENAGGKIYSLWDVYTIADLVTYPSILEGWGNQFLEALVAKLPVAVYKYPVYKSDIEKYQFNVVSFGHQHESYNNWVTVDVQRINEAAEQSLEYFLNADFRTKQLEQNYKTAKRELSINGLQKMLSEII